VKLSNKKIKHIKRQASLQSPEEIAADLCIRVKDVNKILNRVHTGPTAGNVFFLDRIDPLLNGGIIGFSFLAPLLFFRGIFDYANLPQTAFIQSGSVLFLILWLIRAGLKSELRIIRSPFYLPLSALIVWAGFSLFHAHNRYEGLLPWMHWTSCAVLFFLVANCLKKEKQIALLLKALFFSGTLTAMLGIVQHLFQFSWVPQSLPPAATFANKNMASQFIVLTVPLWFGFLCSSEKSSSIWSVCVAGALMIVFLLYTQTRAAWVSLATELVVLAIILIREHLFRKTFAFWNKTKTLAVCVSLIIIFIMINIGPRGFSWGWNNVVERAVSVASYPSDSMETPEEADTSIAWRLEVWENTIEMIKDHFWIGLGLGNHKIFYPRYHDSSEQGKSYRVDTQLANVHNDYLQVFSELGIIAMLLLVWAGLILFRVIRVLLSSPQKNTRFYTIGLTAALSGILINACFSFPFQRAVPPFVVMVYLAILASLYAKNKQPVLLKPAKWITATTTFFLTGTGVWLIYFHMQGIQCDRHYLATVQLDKAKQWQEVIDKGLIAYRLNPDRVMVLSAVGRAYNEIKQYGNSLKVLQKVVDVYPNYINAWLNIGIAFHGTSNDKKALEAYEKTLVIKPDYAKALYNMGIIYMAQKNWVQALQAYKKAATLDPKNSMTHYNLGTAAANTKKYRTALTAFKKAAELSPQWAMAHEALGVVWFQYIGNKKKGLFHLKKALEIDPHIENAERIRGLLLRPGHR